MSMTDKDKIETALRYLYEYGGIDGAHHKAWTLDQVLRALTGCVPDEYGYMHEPSAGYLKWMERYEEADENGEPQYEWDAGIAP